MCTQISRLNFWCFPNELCPSRYIVGLSSGGSTKSSRVPQQTPPSLVRVPQNCGEDPEKFSPLFALVGASVGWSFLPSRKRQRVLSIFSPLWCCCWVFRQSRPGPVKVLQTLCKSRLADEGQKSLGPPSAQFTTSTFSLNYMKA